MDFFLDSSEPSYFELEIGAMQEFEERHGVELLGRDEQYREWVIFFLKHQAMNTTTS